MPASPIPRPVLHIHFHSSRFALSSQAHSLYPMASETLTDYERRRQENMRRNAEIMETLNLHRTASELYSLTARGPQTKKPKPPPSSATRRSLRHRGISPEPLHLLQSKPISVLRSTISTLTSSSSPAISNNVGFDFDPRSSLVLKPGNSTKILPPKVRIVQFLPFEDRTVVVAGDGFGNLGFWDVDCSDGDGVYTYSPHLGPVTGISVHHFSPTKIFTSSYDGFIRVTDFNKENFDGVICSSVDVLFHCVCQSPNDVNLLYIGEGSGNLKVWDQREGKDLSFWELHSYRINTIDFSTQNGNLMATSSSDGRACIWDLRNMKTDWPECLNVITHERAVHSAYFSPSGSCLATTSIDDNIGILRGTNFGDQAMISHKTKVDKKIICSRAIWGWDDSYVFVGSTRAIDVISTSDKTSVGLESPHMNGNPIRLAAHPYKLGSLVGTTFSGNAFLWTKE